MNFISIFWLLLHFFHLAQNEILEGMYNLYHDSTPCTLGNLVHFDNQTNLLNPWGCTISNTESGDIIRTTYKCLAGIYKVQKLTYVNRLCGGTGDSMEEMLLWDCDFDADIGLYRSDFCIFNTSFWTIKEYYKVYFYFEKDCKKEKFRGVVSSTLNKCEKRELPGFKSLYTSIGSGVFHFIRYNDDACEDEKDTISYDLNKCYNEPDNAMSWKYEHVYPKKKGNGVNIVEIIITISSISIALLILCLIIVLLFIICIVLLLIRMFRIKKEKTDASVLINGTEKNEEMKESEEEIKLFHKMMKLDNDDDKLLMTNWRNENKTMSNRLKLIKFDDIKLIKYLASGGSGTNVFLSAWNGQNVVFKSFPILSDKITDFLSHSNKFFEDFKRELIIYLRTTHPFVLKLHGLCIHKKCFGLVTEYCSLGDLRDFLTENKKTSVNEKMKIMYKICSGMAHLHFNNIIHRDLKLRNILIDQNYNPKIMDFGISKLIVNSMTKTRNIGTYQYQAPELVLSGKYDEKVDVFSFGIMSFEILTLNFDPFNSKEFEGNVSIQISTDPKFRPNIKELPSDTPQWFADIIVSCWSHNAKERPAFADVCRTFKKENVISKDKEMNIFEEKQKKDPITIYVKRESEKDDDAEDVDLNVFKINELKRKCVDRFNLGVDKEENICLFLKKEEEKVELFELKSDEDVERLENNSIIIVKE